MRRHTCRTGRRNETDTDDGATEAAAERGQGSAKSQTATWQCLAIYCGENGRVMAAPPPVECRDSSRYVERGNLAMSRHVAAPT